MSKFQYRFQLFLKRLIDISISVLGLIFLSPVLGIIALAIKIDSRGPVLYAHKRVGKDGRPFKMYKFRSMVTGASDAKYMEYLRLLIESERENPDKAMPYRKLEDDPRITRVGRFLRRFYFDELPQLFNILKGEMSLVGPRPHVQYEVDNYTEEQRRRMTVKPGVTGLWQASGKVNSSFNELIAMDLEYIDGWSLSLDFQIVLTTISVILKGGEQIWGNMTNSIPGFRKKHAVPLNGSSVLVEEKEDIGRKK
jgi:lipopolysaccharide/colanic/teichoic acid biosynthesis glycosyltransferase